MRNRVAVGSLISLSLLFCHARADAAETVSWRNGDVQLEGTLFLPKGKGPHPAAIYIHASGDQSRENSRYRVHAKRLTRSGLAMLIYDKRGVGESTGH